MTVYSKTTPIGIDKKLYWIQNLIEAIGWTNIGVYGKLYINEKNGKKIAEAYTGNGEYSEVFVDDRLNAVFGFIVSSPRDGATVYRAKVKLICSVNLTKIYGATERSDEEAIQAVLNAIHEQIHTNNDIAIYDRDDVFSDIDASRFKFRNMQPWYNFAIEFNLNYKY